MSDPVQLFCYVEHKCMNENNTKKLEIGWMELFKKMVKGGRNSPPALELFFSEMSINIFFIRHLN